VIPGEWLIKPGPMVHTRDGSIIANVNFRRPSDFDGTSGDSLLERASALAVRDLERQLRRPLAGVELVPSVPSSGRKPWSSLPACERMPPDVHRAVREQRVGTKSDTLLAASMARGRARRSRLL
jgi:hypothetical protein